MQGWNTNTTARKTLSELPQTMVQYVNFINEFVGAPVKYISNGPGRDQIITI
jgi:adenylosuccinate synthase